MMKQQGNTLKLYTKVGILSAYRYSEAKKYHKFLQQFIDLAECLYCVYLGPSIAPFSLFDVAMISGRLPHAQ